MRERNLRLAAPAAILLAISCVPAVPDPDSLGGPGTPDPADPGSGANVLEVDFEPASAASSVAPVLRANLHFSDPSTAVDPALPIFWMRGETSLAQARLLVRGGASKSALESQIEWLGWQEGSALVVAPTEALAALAPFTLVAGDPPTLFPITVAPADEVTFARRIWPPASELGASHTFAIYCADDPSTMPAMGTSGAPCELRFDPGSVAGTLQFGKEGIIGVPRCVSWRREGPSADDPQRQPYAIVPPPVVRCEGDAGTVAVRLDPSPLEGDGSAPPALPADCREGEVRLGPGCADVQDDRIVIRAPADPLLWAIGEEGVDPEPRVTSGASFVYRVMHPNRSDAGATVSLACTTVDLAGSVRHDTTSLTLAPPRDHVVINEVMANPLGPEPAQEWIELYNDGPLPVDLARERLVVGSADPVPLPEATLEPMSFALLVTESFVADDGADIPPAAGTLLLRLPRLGSTGLTNGGVAIALVDSTGAPLSRFPARAAVAGGISLARTAPDASDDDPASFILVSAAGGRATPGAPNAIANTAGPP